MSEPTLDLAAYFTRIRYSGPRQADLATLQALHAHHIAAIPFENLDVLLGRGIAIDLPSIERKLVHQHRGGYCFEQNGLFRAVLQQLGFQVTPLLARVRWMVPADQPTAPTHMVLQVDVEGDAYLADVGFGGMSLRTPLRLHLEQEQSAVSLEPRRLVARGRALVHQARIKDEWLDVYQIAPEPAASVDFEMGNWFTSTHPQSHFRHRLIAARLEATVRRTLLDQEFTRRQADGTVERKLLTTPEELLAVLATDFDLHFPAGTRFGEPGAPWPR